jgi:hypothetical protein
VLDIIGFVFTIIFIWLGYVHFNIEATSTENPDRQTSWNVIWGACIFFYTLIPFISVLVKTKPKLLMIILYRRP